MSTTTLTHIITDGSGTALAGVLGIARLKPGGRGFRSGGSECVGYETATSDVSGALSWTLERNADIVSPTNSWWEIELQIPEANGGPSVWAVNTDVSGTIYARKITPASDSGLEAHLTLAQADARYARIGSGTNYLGVNPRDSAYGAVGDGTTIDTAAITLAITAANGSTLFFPPGYTFRGTDASFITFSGVKKVIADGANFKEFHALLADGVQWQGGSFSHSPDPAARAMVRMSGSNTTMRDATITIDTVGGDIAYTGIEVRNSGTRPDNVTLDNIDVNASGNSAITLDGSTNVRITNCNIDCLDDGVVLIDPTIQGTDNVTIDNCTFVNAADMLGIGTPVQDGGYVRNVTMNGCTGINVTRCVYLKPGNSSSGYANGLVENITVTDCELTDLAGTRMKVPIHCSVSNGADLKRVRIDGVRAYGRFTDASNSFFAYLRVVDAGSTINDVEISNCKVIDRYGGVVNDVSHPGHPAVDGLQIDRSSSGVCNDVRLYNFQVDGVNRNGVVGGTDDNNLLIVNPRIQNIRAVTTSGKAFNISTDAIIVDPVVDATASGTNFAPTTPTGNIYVRGLAGTSSPESAVSAAAGSTYFRSGTVQSRYDKTSGTGNTGWVSSGALKGSKTWDPASVADGAQANTTVTVTGSVLGDLAAASFSNAVTAGMALTAVVTSSDTVTVTLTNHTGGAVDLASGTLTARVWPV